MDILTGLYVISGLVIVPLVIYGLYARIKVRQLYEKYSKQSVKKGITGSRLARTMLNSVGLNEVVIEEVGGTLKDHYDPRHKVVRLCCDRNCCTRGGTCHTGWLRLSAGKVQK